MHLYVYAHKCNTSWKKPSSDNTIIFMFIPSGTHPCTWNYKLREQAINGGGRNIYAVVDQWAIFVWDSWEGSNRFTVIVMVVWRTLNPVTVSSDSGLAHFLLTFWNSCLAHGSLVLNHSTGRSPTDCSHAEDKIMSGEFVSLMSISLWEMGKKNIHLLYIVFRKIVFDNSGLLVAYESWLKRGYLKSFSVGVW